MLLRRLAEGCFEGSAGRVMLPYLAVAAVVIGLALALWLALGPGPRRRRAFARAQRLLDAGAWEQALAIVESLRASSGLSAAWQDRLRSAAGEAHQLASDEALKEKRFEDALRHA